MKIYVGRLTGVYLSIKHPLRICEGGYEAELIGRLLIPRVLLLFRTPYARSSKAVLGVCLILLSA